MQIDLNDHELELIKEYQREVEKPGFDNIQRITELQLLIAVKVAARVSTTEKFGGMV